ncbi:MAG: hypothetical protein AABY22_21565 [Nanoarchaeota archaeon]
MAKLSTEIKEAKKVLKESKPKIETKGITYKFHYLDDDRIAELVDSKTFPNQYSFLVFDSTNKTIDISNVYGSKDGFMIYPPTKDEEFLRNLIIPKVISIEQVKEALINFDPKELDRQIDTFLRRWFILPDEYFLVLRLFIKFSWVQEQSYMMPYLSLWGDRGTGKTMIGTFLSWLCRFAYFNKAGATPAVLARSIDLLRGVAIIDESDMYLNVTEETASFMRILRGYHADSTYDIVDERKKTKFPRRFYIGVPKVILSAKPIKDDHLSSRCIIMELKPAKIPDEMIRDTKSGFWRERKIEAQEIVNQLLLFRLYKFFDVNTLKTIVQGVEPRYNDVAMPLFYMIENENKEEHEMFYNFVVKNIEVDLEQRSETNEGQILTIIKKLESSYISQELLPMEMRIYVNDIVEGIKDTYYENSNKNETEKFINNRKIGWTLKGLGLKTKKDSAQQGKKYIVPEDLKLLSSLYSRFGVKEEEELIHLTNKTESIILNDENNER